MYILRKEKVTNYYYYYLANVPPECTHRGNVVTWLFTRLLNRVYLTRILCVFALTGKVCHRQNTPITICFYNIVYYSMICICYSRKENHGLREIPRALIVQPVGLELNGSYRVNAHSMYSVHWGSYSKGNERYVFR